MPSYTGVVTSWPLTGSAGTGFGVLTRSGLRLAVEIRPGTRYTGAGRARANVSFVIPGELIALAGRAHSSTLVATQVWLYPRRPTTYFGVVVGAPTPYQPNGVADFDLRVGRRTLTIYVFRATTRFRAASSRTAVLGNVITGVQVRIHGVPGWRRTTLYASSVTINPVA